MKDDYKITTLESVNEAFQLFENMKEIFYFRLFYVIVSGRLAEEYFNNYAEKVINMNILSASIIYCYDDSYHRKKNYYNDPFLNPGGIVSSPDKIVEYIQKVENHPKNIEINPNFQNSKTEGYGYIFNYVDNLSEIILPLIISHFIKSYLISKNDLEEMESNFLSIFGKKIMSYIRPQKEKKINIPLHILAKYYARLYTYEDIGFYPKMNKDLTNKKFDLYRTYIFLLYNGIHKKTLKNYTSSKLYRGSSLSKKEYESIKNYLKKKENKKDISAVLYYLKNFASFSKDEKVAEEFLNMNKMLNKNNKDLISVKYIIDENKDENFFVANIDLENISAITSEKEVLFLPLSCFEIYSIEEKEDYSIIRLKYLTEYKLEMLKYIEELKAQNKIQFFFEKIAESKYSKDIAEIIGPQAQEKIDFFIKKKDINMIKQAILSISSAFFISSFCTGGIKFATAYIIQTFVPSLACYLAYIPSLLPIICGIGYASYAGYNYFKTLKLKSNSLYSKYIPEKYKKEKIFPSFTWENISNKTKSFMIELIEDDIHKKWQVINIPRETNKITENENILGDTIFEYKGISDNASCALFILYELNKEKVTLEEINEQEKLKEIVINMSFLEVY